MMNTTSSILALVRGFRVRELQQVLKELGLPYSTGRKADFVYRVQTYVECVPPPLSLHSYFLITTNPPTLE